jgi:hypothetical protein
MLDYKKTTAEWCRTHATGGSIRNMIKAMRYNLAWSLVVVNMDHATLSGSQTL